jgi:hypothetical protein
MVESRSLVAVALDRRGLYEALGKGRYAPFSSCHRFGEKTHSPAARAQICGSSTTVDAHRSSRIVWRATSTRAVRRKRGRRIYDFYLPTATMPPTLRTAGMMRRARSTRMVRRGWMRSKRTRAVSPPRQRQKKGAARNPSTIRPSPLPSRGRSSSISGSPGSYLPPEVRRHFRFIPCARAPDLTMRCVYRGASDHFSTYDKGLARVFG